MDLFCAGQGSLLAQGLSQRAQQHQSILKTNQRLENRNATDNYYGTSPTLKLEPDRHFDIFEFESSSWHFGKYHPAERNVRYTTPANKSR
jgi:hypothetical protein